MNIKWITIIILGGIFMLIGNFRGLPLFTSLIELYNGFGSKYVRSVIGNRLGFLLSIAIVGIFFIIAGGGASVIIGALLVLIQLRRIGKIIISLGSGMGVLGMIIFILIEVTILNPVSTWIGFGFFLLTLLLDLYFIGILMALIGRRKIKKKGEEEKDLKLFGNSQLDDEPLLDIHDEKNVCPVCNSNNELHSIYCRDCGSKLNNYLENYL